MLSKKEIHLTSNRCHQTIFEAKDKDPLFKQVLPELNDKCQRGTIIPLFNPELNETMVAKRWSFVIKYVKDTAGNISDAPLDLRDLLQTIHSSLAESIATKNEKLAKKKRVEKERRERGKVAEQRVTDSPTTTSSVQPAQVPSSPSDDPAKPPPRPVPTVSAHVHVMRGDTTSLPDPNCTCWGPYHGPVGTYYMAPMPALGHSCLLCKETRARGWFITTPKLSNRVDSEFCLCSVFCL